MLNVCWHLETCENMVKREKEKAKRQVYSVSNLKTAAGFTTVGKLLSGMHCSTCVPDAFGRNQIWI
jgi:hypothetical protein